MPSLTIFYTNFFHNFHFLSFFVDFELISPLIFYINTLILLETLVNIVILFITFWHPISSALFSITPHAVHLFR
jgi:hypothetical protein